MTHAFIILLGSLGAGSESIDSILATAWQEQGVDPAALCSDETFVRRIYLDLAGRIPTPAELENFAQHRKRERLIDELLAGADFPRFWSEVWTATLVGYTNAFDSDREVLRDWLRDSLQRGVGYDRIANELITSRGASALDGPANFLVRHPEDPAVKVCRLFVGVRLDCARCHDHPFDRWTQEDFERMSLFFETTRRQEVSEGNVRLVDEVPDEEETRPQFLTGATPRTSRWRDELGLFVVNCKPFARTYANRVWYQLMGRGIVDPVDDFHAENPASVPELLKFLAERARQDQFDIRAMVRRVCNSRAYQLSSAGGSAERGSRERVFALRTLKPLTPEQTVNAAAVALGLDLPNSEKRELIERMVSRSLDEDFSSTWEYRETVQGLLGRLSRGFRAPTGAVDDLYLRILSRSPTSKERNLCDGRRPEDVAFALVNSNEFFFNH